MDSVSMATTASINGYLADEEPHYSDIPAHKVKPDQNPLLKGHSPAPGLCPQKGARLSTCSSRSSQTYEIINPYSTLDEARNQALMEIKSTHSNEHSDDVLMLNMFGSDRPKWTQDTRPLKLSIPKAKIRRPSSGRMSLGDEEDQYIEMGGDIEGGWGEVPHYGNAFDKGAKLLLGTPNSTGGFRLLYEEETNRATASLDEPDGHELMSRDNPPILGGIIEEAPPLPERNYDDSPPVTDKSIEDLYARVRKKTGNCSDGSNDDVIIVSDDDKVQDDVSSPFPPMTAEDMNVSRKNSVMEWDISAATHDSVFGESVTNREHFNT